MYPVVYTLFLPPKGSQNAPCFAWVQCMCLVAPRGCWPSHRDLATIPQIPCAASACGCTPAFAVHLFCCSSCCGAQGFRCACCAVTPSVPGIPAHLSHALPPSCLCCALHRLSSSLLDPSGAVEGKPSAQPGSQPPTNPKDAPAETGAPTEADARQPTDVFGERDVLRLEARLKWALDPDSPEAAAARAEAEAHPPEVYALAQQEAARFERSLGLVSGGGGRGCKRAWEAS